MSAIEATIEVAADFKYLWIKYVTGTNLDQHCARCLTGSYSKKIRPDMGKKIILLDEYPAKAIYLCGVSRPYRWANNFHLAVVYHPGGHLIEERNGIRVEMVNARRIDFEGFDAENLSSNINRTKKEYHTCRNWIFANHAVVNGLL